MNLGLALLKPAESELGIAMRLWLANRAAWKLTPLGWGERVARALGTNSDFRNVTLPPGVQGLNAVRHIQANLAGTEAELAPASKDMRLACDASSRRNCPECAQLGYHCEYFDYPWLTHCPVHNQTLVRHCPECNAPWPEAADVHSRACEGCGIRQSIEKLIEHGAFDVDRFTHTIAPFVSLFSTPIRFLQTSRRYRFNVRTERHDRFARTLSFPSVLAHHTRISEKDKHALVARGLALWPCHTRSMHLDTALASSQACHGEEEIALVNQCRARVFRFGIRALKAHAGHALGSCQRDPIYRHYDCLYCESWVQWTQGFERQVEMRQHEAMFNYHPPFTRRVRVQDPGLVHAVTDHESHTQYRIAPRIQRLIYQIELWLCFRKMVMQIEFYLNCPFDLRQSYASYPEPDRVFLSHRQHHFGYFYFVKEDEHVKLIFPKAYVDSNLTDHESLLSFFREPM